MIDMKKLTKNKAIQIQCAVKLFQNRVEENHNKIDRYRQEKNIKEAKKLDNKNARYEVRIKELERMLFLNRKLLTTQRVFKVLIEKMTYAYANKRDINICKFDEKEIMITIMSDSDGFILDVHRVLKNHFKHHYSMQDKKNIILFR